MLYRSKRIVIGIVVVIFVVTGGLIASITQQKEVLVTGENFKKPTANTLILNNNIETNNYYRDNVAEDNKGSAVIVENNDYQISYIAPKNTFYIDILTS